MEMHLVAPDAAIRELQNLPVKIPYIIEQVVKKSVDYTYERMIMRCPKKTGGLALELNTLKHPSYNPQNVIIWIFKNDHPAAGPSEFGSGLYGPQKSKYRIPKSGKGGPKLKFRARSGEVIFRETVLHPGQKPRPWMRPGLQEGANYLEKELNRAIGLMFSYHGSKSLGSKGSR